MAKVALWGIPRSLSTAFERSIREFEDVKVFRGSLQAAYWNQSGTDIAQELPTPLLETLGTKQFFFQRS